VGCARRTTFCGVEAQIESLVNGVRDLLGEDVVGAYLHGSAVLGGLRPRSDLDVIVVSKRRTSAGEKRRLVDLLLALSVRGGSIGPPRPIELDVVVHSEIRPWRYPPAFDFHFSELWRTEFESGRVEPWRNSTNPDLASAITMALVGETVLLGPPPAEVFDPVPRGDYIEAILRDTETVDAFLSWDTRNVVLTLPRIWSAIATDDVHSKESAAAWALPRLPEEHRHVLERALATYRGGAEEPWDDILPQVRAYTDCVVAEIKRCRPDGDTHRKMMPAAAPLDLPERIRPD
jgi:predicted nucleotidyltransferase